MIRGFNNVLALRLYAFVCVVDPEQPESLGLKPEAYKVRFTSSSS